MSAQKLLSLFIITAYLSSYSLLCMQNQSQNKCWAVQKIENFYTNQEHEECRFYTELGSSLMLGYCTVAKSASCFTAWTTGDSCSESFKCAFTGLEKGEYCCDSRMTACFSSMCITSDVICALAGLTSLCMQGPCCTKKCFDSKCCKKTSLESEYSAELDEEN